MITLGNTPEAWSWQTAADRSGKEKARETGAKGERRSRCEA
nr:MAG TPA: hypothetical protein [Caudoviricetes sp.]